MVVTSIISGIILSFAFGLLIAGGSWILCVFLAGQINPLYKIKLKHHLFLLVIALFTFILFQGISLTSKSLKIIKSAKQVLKSTIIHNQAIQREFTAFITELPKAGKTGMPQNISDDFFNQLNTAVTKNSPVIGTAINLDKLKDNQDFMKKFQKIASSSNNVNSEKLMELFVNQCVASLERPLIRTKMKLIIALIIIQIIQYAVILRKAKKAPSTFYTDTSYNY